MNIHWTCSSNPTIYVCVGILWVRKLFLSNVIFSIYILKKHIHMILVIIEAKIMIMCVIVKKITQIVVIVIIMIVALLMRVNWTMMYFILMTKVI